MPNPQKINVSPYLTYKLIKNLQDSEDDYTNLDFYEELESRNNDDPTYFVDGAEVMREAKSKYQ